MKVILQQDVHNLGKTGDIVKVRDGHGRNYLVPRGIAVVADERNVNRVTHLRKVAEARAAKELREAQELGTRLGSTAITIRREASEEGKLFGAVTNRDIAEALAAEGLSLDRRKVLLPDPIKNIGVFSVAVKLHRDVQSQIKVYVING
jgi:large subunit ribosomal protein L9